MVFNFLIDRPKIYENLVPVSEKVIMHMYINLYTYNNFRDFPGDPKAILKGHEL